MNISTLEKYDSEKMYKIYDQWPEIAYESFKIKQKSIDIEKIDHIVFAGMGGSGALSDLMFSLFSKTGIHIDIVKGYLLPKTVNSKTLVVTISVSGNTDETLTILETANLLKCKIIAFAAGGQIQEYCKKNNIRFQQISQDHSPRGSFVRYLYSILKILQSTLKIKSSDVNESIKILEKMQKDISSQNLTDSNYAISLAKWISGIPVIYYPWGLEASAIRFKNSLQENAKTHAIIENIIESGHNGIVSWERESSMTPILLTGKNDHTKTKERWSIIREYFEMRNIAYKEVPTIDGGILSKIICMIYVLDYSSIYYAIRLGINPSPINSINFIKERL